MASQAQAAFLASHGFVALALAWYRMPSLPKDMVRVPVDTINAGVDFLKQQPFVDENALGIMGVSWGGILALYAGARTPQLHAVVSLVAGPVVGQGIKRNVPPGDFRVADDTPFVDHGTPVPFVTFAKLQHALDTGDWGSVTPGLIPIWKIKGPILMIAGGDDKLEFSGQMTAFAMEVLREHPRPFDDHAVVYANAGHLIAPGYAPTFNRADAGPYLQVGGSPDGYAAADADVSKQIVSFLRSALSARGGSP